MREIIVLAALWGTAILYLLLKVPKEKQREAQIVFLFSQSVGWLYVYLQTLSGRMIFPFREFPDATKMSLTLYYLFYPAVAVWFILHYPDQKRWPQKAAFYIANALGIQLIAWLIAEYTDLMEYKKYHWFLTFFLNLSIIIVIRIFHVWFRKGLIRKE